MVACSVCGKELTDNLITITTNTDTDGYITCETCRNNSSLEDDSVVWYFTYGANMNDNTLRNRGISPTLSLPGSLPGFHIAFTYNGYDLVEPRFANIEPIESTNQSPVFVVEGIAHRMQQTELHVLDTFEGEGTAYERFETQFQPSDMSIQSFPCYAYRALPRLKAEIEGLPSVRYLKLLVDGGRAAGLSSTYLEKLSSTPCLRYSGTTIPETLINAVDTKDCKYYTLVDIQEHDYNIKDLNEFCESYWITIGGWIFDVTDEISHRAMFRKMSGQDGTFYCLNLWATAYGTGSEIDMQSIVDINDLSQEQQEYISAWLHHMCMNYPVVGALRK